MKGVRPQGYTIVEVMIVLAVSGLMFVIAANFISGKQERASFTSGVNEMAARLDDMIQQVTDGQYSDIPLTCNFTGLATTITPGNPQGQGTNAKCVFLGKILHFQEQATAPDSWPAGDNLSHYEVLSVAGGRIDSTTLMPITVLATAKPTAAHDINKQQIVPQSLDVNKITINPGNVTNTSAFGFFQSQGTSDGAGGIKNGAQTVIMYYLPALPASSTTSTAETKVTAALGATTVDICLTDGKQYATISLGANGNKLATSLKRSGTTKPATCL